MLRSLEAAINEKIARACGYKGQIDQTEDGMLFIREPLQTIPEYCRNLYAAIMAAVSCAAGIRLEFSRSRRPRAWTCTLRGPARPSKRARRASARAAAPETAIAKALSEFLDKKRN